MATSSNSFSTKELSIRHQQRRRDQLADPGLYHALPRRRLDSLRVLRLFLLDSTTNRLPLYSPGTDYSLISAIEAFEQVRDGVIDWAGTDRITRTSTTTMNNGTYDVALSRTWQWNTDSSAVSKSEPHTPTIARSKARLHQPEHPNAAVQ